MWVKLLIGGSVFNFKLILIIIKSIIRVIFYKNN